MKHHNAVLVVRPERGDHEDQALHLWLLLTSSTIQLLPHWGLERRVMDEVIMHEPQDRNLQGCYRICWYKGGAMLMR